MLCLEIKFKEQILAAAQQMGDLQTCGSFSYWGTSLSLSVMFRSKDRLPSMNNDSRDHRNHDVINLKALQWIETPMVCTCWALKNYYSNIAEMIKSEATLYLLYKASIDCHEPVHHLTVYRVYFNLVKFYLSDICLSNKRHCLIAAFKKYGYRLYGYRYI